MMGVSTDDVRRVAKLARLEVSDSRATQLAAELSDILVHMDVLQAVDLTLDAAHAAQEGTSAEQVLRPDVVGSVPLATARDAFAPSMRDGFFLVPRRA